MLKNIRVRQTTDDEGAVVEVTFRGSPTELQALCDTRLDATSTFRKERDVGLAVPLLDEIALCLKESP